MTTTQSTPRADAFAGHTYRTLGLILLREAGADACQEGYGTTDPEWVGRYGLQYGDIERDGTLT